MHITIYRHEEYNKFFVTVDNELDVITYTLYDMSIAEVASFVKTLTA